MEPKAVPHAVQYDLEQLIQDLHDIDGEVQSRKVTPLYGRRDQVNSSSISSMQREYVEAGTRTSGTSQGIEECPWQWIWKKRKDTKSVVWVDRSPHNLTTIKLSRLRNQQKAHPCWRRHQSIAWDQYSDRFFWDKCPDIASSKAKGWKRPSPKVIFI